jgi:Uma2 family endonuclease
VTDAVLEPLLQSPQLIEHAARLNRLIAAERERRFKFHEEITEDGKWEFINGEVVMHSPARHQHIAVTMRIANLMQNWVNLRQLGRVTTEKALCQFPRNDYEPDIAFFSLPKANLLRPDTLLHPVPDLVVEVLSESTEKNDRGVKFADYSAHGVGEYWIVDAGAGTIEQYLLADGRYPRTAKRLRAGKISSAVIAGFTVPVRAAFDDAVNLETLRHLLA